MTATNLLPFELSSDAMTAWVDSLSGMPQAMAAHRLALALKQLKDAECAPEELLPVLIGLTPLALRYSIAVSIIAREQKDFEKSRKPAKLSMQLLRQLSLLFCQLSEREGWETSERQSAIYYGLQSIGHCLHCYSLFYEPPSATLWKKSAILYRLAVELNCLTVDQRPMFKDFKQQASIEAVIKRNLLFSISNATLYLTHEIDQIFALACQYADQLVISTAPENLEFGFYWDLNDEEPPHLTRKSRRPLPLGFLAIDTLKIGTLLQNDPGIAGLTPGLRTRLALQLVNYEPIFDSIVPGQLSRGEFLFSFTDVSAFLSGLNRIQKIKQLSGHKNNDNTKRNLALVPMEREKDAFETMSQMLAKANTISKTGNVLRISNNNYLVAEGNTFECSSGDIAMYYKDYEPATLAIIRQQSALSISNVNHILLEKIIGFYSIYAFKSGKEVENAIVIDEDNEDRQVFLPPGRYNVGQTLNLTIGETMYLTACLESNSYFSRFNFRFGS